jgi:hypothetical protein
MKSKIIFSDKCVVYVQGVAQVEETEHVEHRLQIHPVYFSTHCREARICHETGILWYGKTSVNGDMKILLFVMISKIKSTMYVSCKD